MSENPYEAPSIQSPMVGVKSGSREDVRSVAHYQKAILICILIYLIAGVCRFAIPPELQWYLLGGVIALGVVGTVFVFLLAMKVYSTGIGILLGILTAVPGIGLFVLFIVNQKATRILQQNGFHVGLLGADLSQI